MSDENIYLDLIEERDRLKEKLNKIITQLYNVQAAFNKAEAEKAEMVKWLEELIPFGREQYPDDPPNGLFGTAEKLYEKLTGKPWGGEIGR